MTEQEASQTESGHANDCSTASVRAQLTVQFIAGAVLFAREAQGIEALDRPTPELEIKHMALVVGAITQSAGAIEAQLWEVIEYASWTKLTANRQWEDVSAWEVTATQAQENARKASQKGKSSKPGALNGWTTVLTEAGVLTAGELLPLENDVRLLIDLRNEITHFKSAWGGETSERRPNLLPLLQAKSFRRPPFRDPGLSAYPHLILSADCATWACKTAANFLDAVGDLLDGKSVLDGFRTSDTFVSVLPPRQPQN
ncbi:hypothetical protein [Thiomonas sp. FB-Cd]|uniref:hypothetical protein n=1 Tax=Thiomonas sp. FB-Cd TaxID=1158292 RepID=UPI0012DD5D4C|nr:hypothetical protein [Thiomonas sp. FB-Cd]